MGRNRDSALTLTIQTALDQSGVYWLDAEQLGAMATRAVKARGLAPWWNVHRDRIIARETDAMTGEDGWTNICLSIVGDALTTIVAEGPECVGRRANIHLLKAMSRYQASVRREWRTPEGVSPVMGELLDFDMPVVDSYDGILDDEPEYTDDRVLSVREMATPEQLELLDLIASGVPVTVAGTMLGYSTAWGSYQLKKLARMVTA